MSDRVTLAPDNTLAETIRRLRSDLDEIRSRQSIDRKLVRRSYVNQTSADFDIKNQAVPANTNRLYTITLIGQGFQDYPYGVQYAAVYNNGNLLSDQAINDPTGTAYTWFPSVSNVVNKMSWIISLNTGASGATISIKVRALSTTPGSTILVSWV